jgi:hypothetical protein
VRIGEGMLLFQEEQMKQMLHYVVVGNFFWQEDKHIWNT